ncbi:MAG: 50S ribosomal protein L22 [Myxococcota bacterium]
MAQGKSRSHTAKLRYLRVAPRKVRLLIDMIRSKPVEDALDLLRHSNKGASTVVYKLLDSALSNLAESDSDWDLDRLYVAKAYVDEGPTMRRFRPRAMGRATRIRKRTSHVTIELGEY